MKHIYEYSQYKNYIKDWIAEFSSKGSVSALAKAAGCDRSYLSQVLNSKIQLTPDHAVGMATHLGLNEAEQDFFLLLVLYERASNQEAKKILKKKMDKITRENTRLTKKINEAGTSKELTDQQKSLYYSDALFSLVHTLVSIKDAQTLDGLLQHTRQDRDRIQACLDSLVEMGIIIKNGLSYKHTGTNIHVARGSVYNKMNHFNWRLRAVDDSNNEDAIHYTTVFSISKKDVLYLKQQLLQFIEKQRKDIEASGCEEVYCFACDLFAP